MDRIDHAILGALETDGRQSYATLAESVGLSKTPCWNRVQALEEAGIITGYRADIEPGRLDLGVTAFVQVMIDSACREAFEAAVLAAPAILECHTIAGEADYVLRVACRDVDDLDHLLRFDIVVLPGVQRSSTMICLKTVKRGGRVTQAALSRARSPRG
ncbi:Lrp/AsnC family transcriptional regulator [Sphingomonas alpina]|uniref:Lrp/AsnC family transcriptional regulator n=1 Tax=Sphingomonas alpina TaxID=653931 RepID=A0A7H0LFM6_9SPHN|nr:Lrp/AsnC family transcriptional regulator [Sphingomonas alpina]QNQ08479.1 Lrp/AsnC family transcriptional regulator [Sphingomonas alpina]